MGYADIFILLVLAVSFLVGIYKGFVKEVLSLATLVLSIAAAVYLADYPAGWLPIDISSHSFSLFGATLDVYDIAITVSFILIFLVAMILGYVLTNVINKLIKESPLNWFNRLLGSLFGIARASVLIIAVIIFAQNYTEVAENDWWLQSRTIPVFEQGALWSLKLLPDEYESSLRFEPQYQEPIEYNGEEIEL